MKSSRLLSILMLLQARGRMTAATLAQAMEVSQRTILRDIDQLSAAGVPLWGERGRQGGFQLRPGWSTSLTGLTEAEAGALLLAGLPGPATELGLGSAAASARLKMLASLPGEWREQAGQIGERLHIDPLDWYRAPDTPKHLQQMADAVWHSRRVIVVYDSWRGTSRRELEPLGLVLKAGAWYIAARATGQVPVRIYRLASLLDMQAASGTFRRPRGFDLARQWQEAAARFESELRRVPARLRVSPRGWKWLGNARLQAVECAASALSRASQPGWREVHLPIESIEQGARQMLGFGAEVEVLEPAELRAEVHRLAAQVAALHRKPLTAAAAVRRRATPAAVKPPARE